jgi:peptidoglycan hydrolase CwlO-like protein
MSEEKPSENDPERTLLTLDQLSQTIEVMTSVVNRLRQHLSEQLKAQAETQQLAREEEEALRDIEAEAEAAAQEAAEAAVAADAQQDAQIASGNTEQAKSKGSNESFVVEIRQQDSAPARKNNKTLH